jgi:hypothetical protein
VKVITDDDPETAWTAPRSPHRDETVVLELDDVHSVTALSVSTGPRLDDFPRGLAVATSIDGASWQEVWSGGIAGPIVEAILKDPHAAAGRITFAESPARFVRLRQLRPRPHGSWVIAEVKIYGG